MDGFNSHLTVSTVFSWTLLIMFQTSVVAQICTVDSPVHITENNREGAVVTTINAQPGVTIAFSDTMPADNPFTIDGLRLVAAQALDHETETAHVVTITCTEMPSEAKLTLTIVVIVDNVNDNEPVFAENPYRVNVNEMSPVGTTVGRFSATDLDQNPQLQYTLTSEPNYFALKSPTIPEVIVNATLDYDKVKNVQLVLSVRDGPLSPGDTTSYTASTTILVTIIDVDNRPPWFQPCDKYDINGVVICKSSGYNSAVVLNEQTVGPLSLKPGPLYAIDGDLGINEEIIYSIISGNDENLFEINSASGNITMLKPTNVHGPITLNVLAAQKINAFQFATTAITISVHVPSANPPEFSKALYEGIASVPGNMVMDHTGTALQFLATDKDYIAAGGINPDVVYSIEGSTDFIYSHGYLFLTKPLPDGTVSFNVLAEDTKSGETATTQLSVRVDSGFNPTTLPPSTTGIISTTSVTGSTTTTTVSPGGTITTTKPSIPTGGTITTTKPSIPTGGTITTTKPSIPTGGTITTTKPSIPTGGTITTTKPSIPTGGTITTTKPSIPTGGTITTTKPSIPTGGTITTTKPSIPTGGTITTTKPSTPTGGTIPTTEPNIVPAGGYSGADMAALGATLGILLFIALVVIGVLVCKMRRGISDWRKIYEASVFRSSLGQVGHKEGIQYTNEAFQKDEDGGSVSSGGPDGVRAMTSSEPPKSSWDIPSKDAVLKSSERLNAILPDDTSEVGSDKVENDKEVKPILTKERRVEEGYKSVWFKEDIDPNAKEEVVIIPDSREDDSEEEDEEPSTSGREDDEDSNSPIKTPKLLFTDLDLDSGLGVKMEDSSEEYDDVLNIDL
ncbi:cadherin-related family member 5-like isoform X1 [Mugil cephalus]|uniref:cadherin-related family member 5-like isoform X1 n=1 Tax=Mugil cephalus TaxID=48193 RepID=UPI001FB6FF3B|nr:cadherin-related family member 5-like isoform X1 [Mugil cephalus]XP_047451860.1 cadherin-related family member 5-like isoform X1 [Mugil cephalus]